MDKTDIVTVSMGADLLARFDGWVAARGFPSRSSGVQQLVREKLESLALADETGPAIATVTLVYDHHRHDLLERLAHLQHTHTGAVIAGTHIHIDHQRCFEVLILRGAARDLRDLGESLIAVRGVERGEVRLLTERPPVPAGAEAHEDARGWRAHSHARPRPRRPRRTARKAASRRP